MKTPYMWSLNPLGSNHDCYRFIRQITVTGKEMCGPTIKQKKVNFTNQNTANQALGGWKFI